MEQCGESIEGGSKSSNEAEGVLSKELRAKVTKVTVKTKVMEELRETVLQTLSIQVSFHFLYFPFSTFNSSCLLPAFFSFSFFLLNLLS